MAKIPFYVTTFQNLHKVLLLLGIPISDQEIIEISKIAECVIILI